MKRKVKKNLVVKFIISTILLLLYSFFTILFIINLLKFNDVENLIRVIICIVFGILNILFFIFYYFYFFKKKHKIKINIIIIIGSIVLLGIIFINFNLEKIHGVVNNITDNYEEFSISLVTLSSNKINNVKNIDDSIGVIQDEKIENGYNFAKEIINKNKIKSKLIKYETYLDIVNDLYSGKIKYAFLPSNYESMFSSQKEYDDIDEKLKVIYSESKKVSIVSVNKDINKPFSILLMGVDTLNSSYNADTLILVTFNPQTLSATMLSIPRDTYTTIACTGGKHKINSSGWYSDKCVVDTVSNLVGIEIDYYAKINFVGIVDLVDNLGGIDVDVVYPFCEQNSKRKFGKNMIYVEEGLQHLNGEQALALTRNRKFWYNKCPKKYNEKGYYDSNVRNDITRGLNQQLVLKGILNSLSEIKDLNTVYSLFDTVGNNVSTNMDKNTIFSFYNIFKNIIISSDLSNIEDTFDIKKLSIEVYDTYINISGIDLSMIVAHKNSIDKVSDAMKENLELKEKDLVKSISFDINNPYEEIIIGKGVYGGTTLNLFENFVGKNQVDVKNYCDKNKLLCDFEDVEINDGSYSNGQITSQSIPKNYDVSLIGNKKILFKVAKVVNSNKSFDYSLCTKEDYRNNSKCQIPDFSNKKLSEFNSWYKNFGYLKIKLIDISDENKDNDIITKQNITGKSIYEIYKNGTTIEITYIKNKETPKDENPDKDNNTTGNNDEDSLDNDKTESKDEEKENNSLENDNSDKDNN